MNIEQIAEKIYEVIYTVLMFVKEKVAVLLDFGNAGALPKESLGAVAAIVVFAAIMLLVGIISSFKNHPKLTTFFIILLAVFAVGYFAIIKF